MNPSATASVVSFLTDSLVPFCDSTFLHAVRLYLRASIPAHFASSSELSLSPTTTPPPFIAAVPLPYDQWMFILGNQPILIRISSTEVKAVFATRTAVLWTEHGDEDLEEGKILSIARRATITTSSAVYRAPVPIRLPSPPMSAPIVEDDDSSSSSGSDADSDDGYLSEDSMTSVSSAPSVASVSVSKAASVKAKPYLPRAAPATTYLYQGGKTNVVTGGVMLGGGKHIAPALKAVQNKPFNPARRNALPKARRVLLGPDSSSNWRRRD